jgi:Family of unknown function (DUF6454)
MRNLCAGLANGVDRRLLALLADRTMICGGIALINLRNHSTVHEVPFQKWSPAGHVATRNPFKISASGDQLTVRVAPDNGDENNGTSILTYRATVS